MSTLAPPPPTQPRAPAHRAPGPPASPKRRRGRRWLIGAGGAVLLIVLLPIVILGGAANPPPCTPTSGPIGGGGSGPVAAGHFTGSLDLTISRWYRVGATEYTGTGIGSDGTDLFDYPDSFAELSTLSSNPANSGGSGFRFADADALGELPYMTGLRVRSGGQEMVLYKRDIGYGQGPNGQGPGSLIYRLDVFSASAARLGVSKSPVDIQLAPADGTAPTLDTTAAAGSSATSGCPTGGGGTGPLPPTNSTDQVQIAPDGSATAPASAPQAVQQAVGAANQIRSTPYIWGGGHTSFDSPGYDCSGAVSYTLHGAGLLTAPQTSGELESYADPGPGKWITIYASSGHTWIVIAGRAFDTSHYGPTVPDSSGPRWLADPTGNLADGKSYVVRHPAGL